MASDLLRIKIFALLWRLEIDQGWKQQDHVPSFIHDRCTAICTADFARQLVHGSLFGTFVPAEVVDTISEVDVFFVEDGGPLKGCS